MCENPNVFQLCLRSHEMMKWYFPILLGGGGGIRGECSDFDNILLTDSLCIIDSLRVETCCYNSLYISGGDIDGVSQWRSLNEAIPSNRTEMIYNINEVSGNAAIRYSGTRI